MAHTLKLDPDAWDLTLDSAGRLAAVTGPYAVAQNVANAVRLFTGDAYFNQQDGVPHFSLELGRLPPASLVRSRLNAAALAVPGVASARTVVTALEERNLQGVIAITTTTGETVDVTL